MYRSDGAQARHPEASLVVARPDAPESEATEPVDKLLGSWWHRPTVQIAVVAVAYYVGAKIGLLPALVREQVTPFWPPTGIAVASLLVLGTRVWPGITIGALAVNAPLGPSVLGVCVIAIGNTVAPMLTATLLTRARFRLQLDRLRDGVALIAFGALGMMVSATVGSLVLTTTDSDAADSFWSTWMVWWTGDAMGVLVVAPVLFLFTWLPHVPLRRVRPWRYVEAAAAGLSVEAVAIYATLNDSPGVLLISPVLVWASLRFLQPGAALAVLAVSITAVNAAASGHGFFERGDLTANMLKLQLFNGSAALTALLLAAVIAQRNQTRRQLAETNTVLERRIEERSSQLAHDRSRIAVLADRHRIATELHDLVIQRLFGTGAALDAMAATVKDPTATARLNVVVEDLDATINDLRAAIFQIDHDVETTTLREAVAHVLAAASHSIGFVPELHLYGDQERIPHAVRPQILATLQEILNDLESRPGVTAATVDLHVAPDELIMTISESGPHLRTGEPSGAMRTVVARAERLGGSCMWRFDGGQTLFEWRIPISQR